MFMDWNWYWQSAYQAEVSLGPFVTSFVIAIGDEEEGEMHRAKELCNGDVAVPRGEETCHDDETRTARFAGVRVEVLPLRLLGTSKKKKSKMLTRKMCK